MLARDIPWLRTQIKKNQLTHTAQVWLERALKVAEPNARTLLAPNRTEEQVEVVVDEAPAWSCCNLSTEVEWQGVAVQENFSQISP